ncbi:MAG: DUF4238 domain-containing protein [Lachnospiraceae bacterium]|nr:DUF4238 domain-containing protein [Lachnospiraceae bacterium]
MHSNIPIRHHYIPQFLLRQFRNGEGYLGYCDKKSFETLNKKPEEVFMVRNLYRDTINNPGNPVQIENDFSKFEREASEIIHKFFTEPEITISVEEEEKLKLFFALMGIRSKGAAEKFSQGLSEDSKKFYSVYQENGDFSDFWKRNLSLLVKCRSYTEVDNNPDIDKPIKIFMRRDTCGFMGLHFAIAEKRGQEDFIIGDSYPVEVSGFLNGNKAREYSIFPISSDRVLFMADNILNVVWNNKKLSDFERELKTIPPRSKDGKTIRYHVKKIYESDVKLLNAITFDGAEDGVAFKDRSKVSLSEYAEIYKNWTSSGEC